MPLPDATTDKRIYELLKTVDLENLTFSDLQAVGQTIYAEQGAEDELRRLVLLNLARLSVVGEWTGLTSAGGGGGTSSWGAKPVSRFTGSGGDLRMFTPASGYNVQQTNTGTWATGLFLYPFMASDDNAIDAIQIYANNTIGTTTKIGVYNTLDSGLPDALQVSADISNSSTGLLTQTSLTGSLTLQKGETYWMGFIVDSTSQQIAAHWNTYGSPLVPLPQTAVTLGNAEFLLYDSTPTSLPATITLSDFDPVSVNIMNIGLRLA
jgi:hypothetical protein